MSLTRILLRSFFWRCLYYLSILLLNIVIARHLQAAGSGWLYFINNVLALVLLVTSLCLETAMGYYLAKGSISAARLANLSVVWTLLGGALCFGLVSLFFRDYFNQLSGNGFYIIALSFIAGSLLSTYFAALFFAVQEFRVPNAIMAGSNLLLMGIIAWGGLTPPAIVQWYFCFFLVQGIILAIVFYSTRVEVPYNRFPSVQQVGNLLRYSGWAVVTNLLSFLVLRIDYWFVNKYCTDTALGNYIQVAKLYQLFLLIPSILSTAVFPVTASSMFADMSKKIQLLLRNIIVLSGAGCLLLLLTGKWLFPAVFGDSFAGMYIPFVLLAPGIVISTTVAPVNAYYAGRSILHVNLWASVIALVITVAGDLLIIPRMGIMGAAIVSSVSYMMYAWYLVRYFTREHRLSFSDILKPTRADFTWIKSIYQKQH